MISEFKIDKSILYNEEIIGMKMQKNKVIIIKKDKKNLKKLLFIVTSNKK